MSERHGPEPWCTGLGKMGTGQPGIFDAEGKPIGAYEHNTPERVAANAARIVACINFCEGTDNDYLRGAGNLGRLLVRQAAPDVNAALLAAARAVQAAAAKAASVWQFGELVAECLPALNAAVATAEEVARGR